MNFMTMFTCCCCYAILAHPRGFILFLFFVSYASQSLSSYVCDVFNGVIILLRVFLCVPIQWVGRNWNPLLWVQTNKATRSPLLPWNTEILYPVISSYLYFTFLCTYNFHWFVPIPVAGCGNRGPILPQHLISDEELKFRMTLTQHSTMIHERSVTNLDDTM